jgi:hypothetical protein
MAVMFQVEVFCVVTPSSVVEKSIISSEIHAASNSRVKLPPFSIPGLGGHIQKFPD